MSKRCKTVNVCLCDDVWGEIIGFLPIMETLTLSLTSKGFYELCNADFVWKEKLLNIVPKIFADFIIIITKQDFKKVYSDAKLLKTILLWEDRQNFKCLIRNLDELIRRGRKGVIGIFNEIKWLLPFLSKCICVPTEEFGVENPTKWEGLEIILLEPYIISKRKYVLQVIGLFLNGLTKYVNCLLSSIIPVENSTRFWIESPLYPPNFFCTM